jgi:ATP-dependent Clp protease ATP-binding subunit ClpA
MDQALADSARNVVEFAKSEARELRHEYVGTEHILLCLLKGQSSVAANVLKNLGVDEHRLRTEIVKIIGQGPYTRLETSRLPLTPRAKKVLEYAIDESRQLRHTYVGTEHLLLGLLRETEGVAAQVLINVGLSLKQVRKEVLKFVGGLDDVTLHTLAEGFELGPPPEDLPATLELLPEQARQTVAIVDQLIKQLRELADTDQPTTCRNHLLEALHFAITLRRQFIRIWLESPKTDDRLCNA